MFQQCYVCVQLEKEQKSGVQQPQTADDFDRLVLESPDSSLVWLRYVAYHLEMTEIERARAVLERALQTINFRCVTCSDMPENLLLQNIAIL